MQNRFSGIWPAGLVIGCLLGPVAGRATAATVATQYLDYAPGQTVVITGSGWKPGEAVVIELHEDPMLDPDRLLTAVADANGDIFNHDFLVDTNDQGVRFTLTATGLLSGQTAQTTFSDAPAFCPGFSDGPGGFVPDKLCTNDFTSVCRWGCRNGSAQSHDGVAANQCHPVASTPADADTACADDGNACTADVCDGDGTCTHPAGNADVECRASASDCDLPAHCTGASADCPANPFRDSTFQCRAAAGDCDLAAHCTGASATCPPNAFQASTFQCRAAAGDCDLAAHCTGASAACPANGFRPSTTVCRSAAGVCDLAAHCTGSSATCPPNGFKPSTTVCRSAAGVCDLTDYCPGNSANCPNAFKPSTAVCRASQGPCDAAENCTGSSAACPADTIVPCSLVTDSSLCTFDVDTSTTGSQFRLILTPDQNSPSAWKLNASNPGQFYYNIIYVGSGNTTLNITLPYPFVTQGAVPIHVYSGVTRASASGITCFAPGTEIRNSSTQVTLGSYSSSTTTVQVTLPDLSNLGGVAYINMHLDYGLKGTTNYSKDSSNNAIDATSLLIRIPDKQSYLFSDSTGNDTVQSENTFKRDPGIGGLVVQSSTTNPLPNVKVQIYDSSNKLLATVYTDQDGWYMWQYKYTGKAATFTVKLPNYNLVQSVTLKSNGFVLVYFTGS